MWDNFKTDLQELECKLCNDNDDLFALIEDLKDEEWNNYDEFVEILEEKEIFYRIINNYIHNKLYGSIKSGLTRIIPWMEEVPSQSFRIDDKLMVH